MSQQKYFENCWIVYAGEALTDRSVKPAVVFVTPRFSNLLAEFDAVAWQSLMEYSEELIESQIDESHFS